MEAGNAAICVAAQISRKSRGQPKESRTWRRLQNGVFFFPPCFQLTQELDDGVRAKLDLNPRFDGDSFACDLTLTLGLGPQKRKHKMRKQDGRPLWVCRIPKKHRSGPQAAAACFFFFLLHTKDWHDLFLSCKQKII
ncbi:hypothetical protein BHM03_00016715 [Ensete ventricosum]|nr:hypothetical protein BHM03_00016715 [Ensete ventricosum]